MPKDYRNQNIVLRNVINSAIIIQQENLVDCVIVKN